MGAVAPIISAVASLVGSVAPLLMRSSAAPAPQAAPAPPTPGPNPAEVQAQSQQALALKQRRGRAATILASDPSTVAPSGGGLRTFLGQ